ncbi:protein kinase [Streptomyces sp. H10-C2]|uniref:protein kinase domain-containing protein n=1 Tax=unclassified Streptomyces TaxID=2593676 RepID=UPI0024BBAD01|nr:MULTISPECIES: serine/threonine protein kinase [unclassified Streptomyces]MDJ0347624.1 protein kinase [Streptomyces sp. PH10-H1]MDJ0375612.1 protein kinase [Streptomyces sp. H10-C2]
MYICSSSVAPSRIDGPLTVPEAARIGRGVLSALRAAHAAGVQHRDVKPGNVLLRTDGTPVLTDFGIAALHGTTALTMTGALIGSPEYIAPERIRGVEGNPASDLWSLGMMLYVAVEGRHPLRRATTLATLAAVLDEPLPPPVRSGRLGPVLTALLAKDPAARPDADQLDRLLAAAENHAGAAAPVGSAAWGSAFPGTPNPGNPGPHAPIAPADSPRIASTAGWVPPGKLPAHPTPPGRRRHIAMAALSATAVVLAGALAWNLAPGGGHSGTQANGTTAPGATTTSSASPGSLAPNGPKPGDTPAPSSPTASVNLLTPAGVRGTIAAMRPFMGGTKVKELLVYPGYASAEAPTPADPKLYDEINYRDGKATHSPGGTMGSDDATVNLQSFNWDVLPGLLDKAQKTLNVPHPTSRYLIVGPDMFDGTPTFRVYLSDAYGSGYLSADTKGAVKRSHPRGS